MIVRSPKRTWPSGALPDVLQLLGVHAIFAKAVIQPSKHTTTYVAACTEDGDVQEANVTTFHRRPISGVMYSFSPSSFFWQNCFAFVIKFSGFSMNE